MTSKEPVIDIINKVRLGTTDYDFSSLKLIKEGGQALVGSIKSNIDDKTYAAKKLSY
jgi:hypothetical protein